MKKVLLSTTFVVLAFAGYFLINKPESKGFQIEQSMCINTYCIDENSDTPVIYSDNKLKSVDGEPLSGKLTVYNNGYKVSVGNYKNGSPDGQFISYLQVYGCTKIDAIRSMNVYKNGKMDGVSKTYYCNGNIMTEYAFIEGEAVYNNEYYSNGKLKSKTTYTENDSRTSHYYKTGQPIYEQIQEKILVYYPDGRLMAEGYEKDKDDLYAVKLFKPDGLMILEYLNNKGDISGKAYDDDGNMRIKLDLKLVNTVKDNDNYYSGMLIYYNTDGTTLFSLTYDNNMVVKSTGSVPNYTNTLIDLFNGDIYVDIYGRFAVLNNGIMTMNGEKYSGMVVSEILYINSIVDYNSALEFLENTELFGEYYEYTDGKISGKSVSKIPFYSSIYIKEYLEDGIIETSFDEDFMWNKKITITNGNNTESYFYFDNHLMHSSIIKSSDFRQFRFYHLNGSVYSERLRDGEINTYTAYYDNGNIMSETIFDDSYNIKLQSFYYENGQVKMLYTARDSSKIARYYKKDGALWHEVAFDEATGNPSKELI